MNLPKSKSFDSKQLSDQQAFNKIYDFISLYKSAAETANIAPVQQNLEDGVDKENSFKKSKPINTKCDRSPSKKKKRKQEPLDISRVNIEGPSTNMSLNTTPLNESTVTSTPSVSKTKNQMKSIMKNSSEEDYMDSSKSPTNKSKKRNKSVSFMLDETEEVVKKKTKSDDLLNVEKKDKKEKSIKQNSVSTEINKLKKLKKVKKERLTDGLGDNVQINNMDTSSSSNLSEASNQNVKGEKTKKVLKSKTQKKSSVESLSTQSVNNNNEEQTEHKNKKYKKKKRVMKSVQPNETEPASKARKVDVKPEVIVENLENLSIADNAHTLSNLLDEMTLADKDKRKKHKRKLKKNNTQPNVSSSDNTEVEKNEKGKEKPKWHKRKWNRDKKGEIDDEVIANTVIVENLPLNIMCSYKKLLTEHFQQYGIVKRVGIAEVYPSKSSDNMTFTTTIIFYSDGAASKSLEANNTLFEGNNIQVKQKLPPDQTTVVVRSYAPLSDQNISTVFSEAGQIRNIRHLVKGKKAIETAFVEFDKPEAVTKAKEIAKTVKIEGKRVHVHKYELRKKKKGKLASTESEEGDSEDSND
ncbi:serine/threonine-protein kinase PRP4 homolog isoform X1 [Galleria mellonella]|uniref:Serine/threonine-protein kinase PRP4 homolog isoform X1 n=1 Tax=Galleria mellonella TaxID=7137 RepID=A0A6J1X8N2_GALME|nr:serine/threonine-protein kinase PRP4 homolog isoform X1 [Galleria mellonella]